MILFNYLDLTHLRPEVYSRAHLSLAFINLQNEPENRGLWPAAVRHIVLNCIYCQIDKRDANFLTAMGHWGTCPLHFQLFNFSGHFRAA